MEKTTPAMDAGRRYNERQADIEEAIHNGFIWVTGVQGSILYGYKAMADGRNTPPLCIRCDPVDMETLPLFPDWDIDLPKME